MKRVFALCVVCGLFFVQLVCLEAQMPRDARSFFDDAISDMEKAFSQNDFIPEDEYYLGRAVAANILAAYKPYTENPELTRYVNRICQTIVINSVQPVIFKNYSVIILDSNEFNAFASPGGHIFITRGLVESTASEDMLAAVIAHELAHIMLKHSIDVIELIRLNDQMAAMADRAAALAGNSEAAQRLLNFRNSVSSVLDILMKNGYSQAQEFEADREAAALLAASGYNPWALVEILQVLQRVQASQMGGFNATHPSPGERITNVEGSIRRYRVEDTRSYRVPRFMNQ